MEMDDKYGKNWIFGKQWRTTEQQQHFNPLRILSPAFTPEPASPSPPLKGDNKDTVV